MTPTQNQTAIENEIFEAAAGLAGTLRAKLDADPTASTAGFSQQVWEAARDAGWFEVAGGEEHGGLGLGMPAAAAVLRAVGYHALPGPFAERVAVIPDLLSALTPEGRDALAAIDQPDTHVVLVDPAASCSSAAAVVYDAGVLSGSVDLVRFGDIASWFLVVATAGGGSGADLTIALVESTQEGVDIHPHLSFDPVTRYATVRFAAVTPMAMLVAPGSASNAAAARLRSVGRIAAAAEAAGLARALTDKSTMYALERHQFGRPIGAFQAIQHILADMAADCAVLEARVSDIAGERYEDSTRHELMAWTLKSLAATHSRRVAESALQVHGGVAFTEELGLHHWVNHVLALQGLYGDEDQLDELAGAALVAGELSPWD